jgi:hypothetical protein
VIDIPKNIKEIITSKDGEIIEPSSQTFEDKMLSDVINER